MKPHLAAGSPGADRMAFLSATVGSIGTVISIALVMWLATIVAF
jgi:hypothetical protein